MSLKFACDAVQYLPRCRASLNHAADADAERSQVRAPPADLVYSSPFAAVTATPKLLPLPTSIACRAHYSCSSPVSNALCSHIQSLHFFADLLFSLPRGPRSCRRFFHSSRALMNAPGAAVPSDRVKMLAEEIPKLNLLEVNDLMKLLQVLFLAVAYLTTRRVCCIYWRLQLARCVAEFSAFCLASAACRLSFHLQTKLGLPDMSMPMAMAPAAAPAAGGTLLCFSLH